MLKKRRITRSMTFLEKWKSTYDDINSSTSDDYKLKSWKNFVKAEYKVDKEDFLSSSGKYGNGYIKAGSHYLTYIFNDLLFEKFNTLNNLEFILTTLNEEIHTGEQLYTFITHKMWIMLVLQLSEDLKNKWNSYVWKKLLKEYNITVFDPSINLLFQNSYNSNYPQSDVIIDIWYNYKGHHVYPECYLRSIYSASRYDHDFQLLDKPNWIEFHDEKTRYKYRGAGFKSNEPILETYSLGKKDREADKEDVRREMHKIITYFHLEFSSYILVNYYYE